MTIPKTNLFKGDRVMLSQSKLNEYSWISPRRAKNKKGRIGTIITDTLDPNAEAIAVRWDGNKAASKEDMFMPEDLVLVEEEAHNHA